MVNIFRAVARQPHRQPFEHRRGGSAAAWSPLALFSSGEQGVWYDPSDMSTMWQDSAGTTPVTAADQPVGKMLDKSGNGNHWTQPTAGKRLVLKTDGTLWWLQVDGVDDFGLTGSIDFTGTDKMSVWAGVTKTASTAAMVVENDGNYSVDGSYYIVAPDAPGTYSFLSKLSGSVSPSQASTVSGYPEPDTSVLTCTANGTNGQLYVNGIAGPLSTSMGVGNFGNHGLYLFSRSGTGIFFSGRLYSLIIRGAETADLSAATAYTASKTGVTL